MEKLLRAVTDFKNQDGLSVLGATVVSKGLNFLLSFFIIKILSTEAYGNAIYALNIVSFAMPLAGLGAYQGILRFGALATSQKEKKELFFYGLLKGLLFSLGIVGGLYAISYYFKLQNPIGGTLIQLIAFQVITYTFYEALKSYVRIHHFNKAFAGLDFSLFTIQFALGISLGYLFGGRGYLTALVVLTIPSFPGGKDGIPFLMLYNQFITLYYLSHL